MTRIMDDSVNPEALLLTPANMVAGYTDGPASKWPDSAWGEFPPEMAKVRITVLGGDADVADVENGDLTPADAAAWLRKYPERTIFCNRSTRPLVEEACIGLVYSLWISTLDGTQTVPGIFPAGNVVAVQYLAGGTYDSSIVYADGWHPSPTRPDAHQMHEAHLHRLHELHLLHEKHQQ